MQTDTLYEITSPQNLSVLFRLSMWWRIVYGIIRVTVGVSFLHFINQPLTDFVYRLMSHELLARTSDAVLEKIYYLFQIHEFTVTYFIAGYFIFWGVIEIVLSLCLLRKMPTAFPIAMGLIIVFIMYATFRYFHTHSLILLCVILIDITILYLINHEYRNLLKKLA